MIREATQADIPRIVQLGSQSLIDGPYKDLLKDTPEQTAKLALEVIRDKGKILLYENDEGKVCGLLGFIIFPHYFTGEITAGELMWYVEPHERMGCPAFRLLWEAEKLAKSLGAKRMQLTAPTTKVEEMYKRFGYQQIEVSFQKEI